MDAAWEIPGVDAGAEVVKWVGEAVAASLVGSIAAWLSGIRSSRAKAERLESRVARQDSRIDELEARCAKLEEDRVRERVQSSADHTQAANLAGQVAELKAQGQQTHSTLMRVLGLLQGKGIGGNFG
jgi:hypothetical protein